MICIRKVPKTFNIDLDLLIYIEKKAKELGERKESELLNQILSEYKEKDELNALPKEQSKITVKTIKNDDFNYKISKEFEELKKKHPKLMRECLKQARAKAKAKGGFEKKHKKILAYLKERDKIAVKLLKEKLKQVKVGS